MGTINRIKVVLTGKWIINKWLAKAIGTNETTVSRWFINESQPSVETFVKIAEALKVDVRELFNSTK